MNHHYKIQILLIIITFISIYKIWFCPKYFEGKTQNYNIDCNFKVNSFNTCEVGARNIKVKSIYSLRLNLPLIFSVYCTLIVLKLKKLYHFKL